MFEALFNVAIDGGGGLAKRRTEGELGVPRDQLGEEEVGVGEEAVDGGEGSGGDSVGEEVEGVAGERQQLRDAPVEERGLGEDVRRTESNRSSEADSVLLSFPQDFFDFLPLILVLVLYVLCLFLTLIADILPSKIFSASRGGAIPVPRHCRRP